MVKVIIYPGCMVLARFQEYEIASQKVLEQLGYEIVGLDVFCCCGASLLPGVTDNWINLAVYSLALAEKSGADIVTLCGNCTNNFRRANLYFEKDAEVRENIGSVLGKLGLRYSGGVIVRHIIDILYSRRRDIQKRVKKKLRFKVALTHPCQVFRPKGVTGTRDYLAETLTSRAILKSLDIETIDYPKEYECCGATALLFDEELGIRQGKSKLESAKAHGADVVCAACGNCLFLLDRFQNTMFQNHPDRKIPVISLSQLVALAFDSSEEVLNFSYSQRLFDIG